MLSWELPQKRIDRSGDRDQLTGSQHPHPYQSPPSDLSQQLDRPSPYFSRPPHHPSSSAPSLLLSISPTERSRAGPTSLGQRQRTATSRSRDQEEVPIMYGNDDPSSHERRQRDLVSRAMAGEGELFDVTTFDDTPPFAGSARSGHPGSERPLIKDGRNRGDLIDLRRYMNHGSSSGHGGPSPMLSPPSSSTFPFQDPLPSPVSRTRSATGATTLTSLDDHLDQNGYPSPTRDLTDISRYRTESRSPSMTKVHSRSNTFSPLLTPPHSSTSPTPQQNDALTSFLSVGGATSGAERGSTGSPLRQQGPTGTGSSTSLARGTTGGGRDTGRTISNASKSSGGSSARNRVSFASTHPTQDDRAQGGPSTLQKKLNSRSQPLWDFLTSEEVRREGGGAGPTGSTTSVGLTAGQGMGREKGIEGVKEWLKTNIGLGSRFRDLSQELELLREELPYCSVYNEIFASHEVRLAIPLRAHHFPPLMNDYSFYNISKNTVIQCLVEANEEYAQGGKRKEEKDRVATMQFLERMTGLQTMSDLPTGRAGSDRIWATASFNDGEERSRRRMPLLPNPTLEMTPSSSSRSITTLDGSTVDKPKGNRRPSTIREHPSPTEGGSTYGGEEDSPTSPRSSVFSPFTGTQSVASTKAEKLLGLVGTKTSDGSVAYNDLPQARSPTPDVEKKGGFWRKASGPKKEKGSLALKSLASTIFGGASGGASTTKNERLAALRSTVGREDPGGEIRNTPAFRATRSMGSVPMTKASSRCVEKRPEISYTQTAVRQDTTVSSEMIHAQLTTSGHVKSSSRILELRAGGLHEEQVLEVLMTYIAKRMRGIDLVEERAQKGSNTESSSPVAFVKGQQAGTKAPASSGAATIEAVISKLNHIKFELMAQSQGTMLPPIESALDRVRFGLGFNNHAQLVKRLQVLAIVPPRKDVAGDPTIAEQQQWVRNTMISWIKLRESAWISRWEIARLVKQEVLGKLDSDLQDLVLASMSSTRLPVTPFPPRKANEQGNRHLAAGSSASKLGNFVNSSAVSLSLAIRRPSLPGNLAAAHASTTSVNSVISTSSGTSSMSPGGTIDAVVNDILALPTAGNTREILMTWIGRERRRRLHHREGWWIAKAGSLGGPSAFSEAMCRVEMDCLAKGQKGLTPVFRQFRVDMLLPPSPFLPATAIKTSAVRDADRSLSESPASDGPSSPLPTVSGLRDATDASASTGLVSLPVPPRPSSAMKRRASDRGVIPAMASSDIVTSPAVLGSGSMTHSSTDLYIAPSSLLNGLGIDMAPELRPRRLESDESTVVPSMGTYTSETANFGSEAGSIAHSRRGKASQYRLSESSVSTALEMASIFGTRDVLSRASNHSRDPSGRIGDEDVGVDVIAPLSAVTEEVSEMASSPRSTGPVIVGSTLPATSTRYKFPGLFGLTGAAAGHSVTDPDVSFQAEHNAESDDVCPFPAPLPGSRPPSAIPSRASSLNPGVADVAEGEAEVPTAPPRPLQLRLNTDLSAPPVEPGDQVETSLGMILQLFNANGKIKADITPAQLRIVLLKVVDLEQRSCSEAGRRWLPEDVIRVTWLINQVRQLIGLKQLDRLFNGVIATMEETLNSSSQGSMQSIAQMSMTPSQATPSDRHFADCSFPTSPSARRNTFGPDAVQSGLPVQNGQAMPARSLIVGDANRTPAKTDRSDVPVQRAGYDSPPIPVAGQLRLVGSPVAPASTMEGSQPESDHAAEDEELANQARPEVSSAPERDAIHSQSSSVGTPDVDYESATPRRLEFVKSRSQTTSSRSSIPDSGGQTGPPAPRTDSQGRIAATAVSANSGIGSGAVGCHPASRSELGDNQSSSDTQIQSHQPLQSEEDNTGRSPLSSRSSFDAYSLKEAPPPPYDPLASLIEVHGTNGHGEHGDVEHGESSRMGAGY